MQSVENPNMVIFFEGKVTFVSQGFFRAKYIVENGSVIKVKNSTHVRKINQYDIPWPKQFEIIAPLDAIKIINGNLPEEYLSIKDKQYYLDIRMMFDGE